MQGRLLNELNAKPSSTRNERIIAISYMKWMNEITAKSYQINKWMKSKSLWQAWLMNEMNVKASWKLDEWMNETNTIASSTWNEWIN